MDERTGREEALRDLRRLHAEVDAGAGAVARRHGGRLRCRRGCSDCCVDEQSVFPVEAELLRRRHGPLLAAGRPAPAGRCAFLSDDGACRVYESRPYRCRTQGLPLRWLDERDGVPVELRDICPLNEPGPPVEELPEEACWTLGPAESRLVELQRRFGGSLERVALRDLFARTAPAARPADPPGGFPADAHADRPS